MKAEMKAKQETGFYERYEYPRVAKAAIEVTRAHLLQGLGKKVQFADEPIAQPVRIHILTPVLRSQQDRKLGRMRMAEPSRRTPMKGMQTPGRSAQPQGNRSREGSESSGSHRTPELARLTIAQRKMERNAQLTGVQLTAKQEEGAKSMKIVSPEAFKGGKDFKLRKTSKQIERERRRRNMKNALKYIIDFAVRRRNALRGTHPASPLLQVPESRRKPRKRMPESTFATQAGSSGNISATNSSLLPELDSSLAKCRSNSQLDPSTSVPLPIPVPVRPFLLCSVIVSSIRWI